MREERGEGMERGGLLGGKSLFWESASMQASLLRREVGASLCCVADLLKVSICLSLRSYAVLCGALKLHTMVLFYRQTASFHTGLTTLV